MPRKCSASADDAVVVRAALHDRVHLHGQACGGSGVDSVEHPLHGEVDVVQRAERGVVDRVEADGDAVEACARERFGLLRQKRAVRRERELETRDRVQLLDELFDVAADERLAARDPHDPYAEPGENGGDTCDLLEAQQLLALEEDVVAAVDLFRHAVDAAKVAAVGDRDAERLERPVQLVEERFHAHTVTRRSTVCY